MRYGNQTTLRSWAVLDGFGVHSNSPVKLTLSPSEAGSGITFLRT
ncbi:MAG: UDP-3-O-acyl-N-acetylglucosamine deacetylase, partial [Hyphomicrobiales bacterium]|nr:UDP-3-O-acyl-N-acetylglucosamine deacetylase [Hyphomicrobiales bacterium]